MNDFRWSSDQARQQAEHLILTTNSKSIMSSVSATPTTASVASATSSQAAPTCSTAVPGKNGHVPIDACNSYYAFDPSFEGNVAFAVLFGLSMIAHVVQAITYRKVRKSSCSTYAFSYMRHRGSAGSSSLAHHGKPQPSFSEPSEPTTSSRLAIRLADSCSSSSHRSVCFIYLKKILHMSAIKN